MSDDEDGSARRAPVGAAPAGTDLNRGNPVRTEGIPGVATDVAVLGQRSERAAASRRAGLRARRGQVGPMGAGPADRVRWAGAGQWTVDGKRWLGTVVATEHALYFVNASPAGRDTDLWVVAGVGVLQVVQAGLAFPDRLDYALLYLGLAALAGGMALFGGLRRRAARRRTLASLDGEPVASGARLDDLLALDSHAHKVARSSIASLKGTARFVLETRRGDRFVVQPLAADHGLDAWARG